MVEISLYDFNFLSLSICLDSVLCVQTSSVSPVYFFLNFLLRPVFLFDFVCQCTVHTSKISGGQCTPVGLVHCSWDSQTSFLSNFFIKNGSHGIIHTIKNYFVIMFLVFSKISSIQIGP